MVFRKNKGVVKRDKIQIELIKLTGGERTLRSSDLASGLAIEKKLDPQLSVNRQKERPFTVFEAALARSEPIPA
jgi:hypothetical protein